MEKAKKIIIGTLLIFFGIILIDYVIEVLFRGTEFVVWKTYITTLRVWLTRLIISIALAYYNVWKQEKRENAQKMD
ncbi:hypothetical protein MM213_09175 [Belliella sp. R4-6]|uniref:Uncharacterized protein n=1 Tax=Belliella alkalica TaxID=1730871 RepID=A0ABS9VC81_9BACT|nr:hypothetical protein [Belliella alkalica]MCH7413655.1 hypothetical protein [Belliella alkalica]